MLYQTYQFQDDLLAPLRDLAQFMNSGLQSFSPLPANHPFRRFAAAWELISRYKLSHERPDFAIDTVRVGNRDVPVTEDVALDLPFGKLLKFSKDVDARQPRVLVVAPLSGHFATLLRGTVATLLQDHEVYITDWTNARDVPLEAGRSASRTMSNTLSVSSRRSGRARISSPSASPACRRWSPSPSCPRKSTRRHRIP
jgi:poly(3-hydroxybutyrate) depolymerase